MSVLIPLAVFAACLVGGFLPAFRHQRRLDNAQAARHNAELVRWAREDGLPGWANVEQLRAYYAARYP